MIVLGIDPGSIKTGFALLQIRSKVINVIDFGVIKTSPTENINKRFLIIFKNIDTLIKKYSPTCLAIESQFLNKNFQSALKIGIAKGIITTVAMNNDMEIFEYTPKEIKKAIVNGRASKQQIQLMIKMLLNLEKEPPEDAADALAVAICHSNKVNFYV